MLAIEEFEAEHDKIFQWAKYILRKGDGLPNQHFDEDKASGNLALGISCSGLNMPCIDQRSDGEQERGAVNAKVEGLCCQVRVLTPEGAKPQGYMAEPRWK
jgi:hypothetical protein